jgi:hypothetical protein
MLHFLLIVLAIVALWKLLSHGSVNRTTLLTGLRRIAFVLAIAGSALGGLIGYIITWHCTYETAGGSTCTGPEPGAIVLGAVIGFGVIWAAASVLIWIIRGFTTP